MRVGSLFSGIGGLDLGLERAGMSVVWQSEIDPYASKVLAKHWPNTPNLGDIKTIDWSTVEPVDLICGGYPCQPFSLAGVRRGDTDPRHLWPYFAAAIRELRPEWALLENVPGHLSMGFGRVLGDLAELGFDAEWQSIPAAAVGAPHLRYRIFVVAHAQRLELRHQPVAIARRGSATVARNDGAAGAMADADDPVHVSETASGRHEVRRGPIRHDDPARRCLGSGTPSMADPDSQPGRRTGDAERGARATPLQVGPAQPGRCRGDVPDADSEPADGSAVARRQRSHWATEPDVGRVAHGIPHRVDRLRALGNAVVPQVAEFVGRRIMAAAL